MLLPRYRISQKSTLKIRSLRKIRSSRSAATVTICFSSRANGDQEHRLPTFAYFFFSFIEGRLNSWRRSTFDIFTIFDLPNPMNYEMRNWVHIPTLPAHNPRLLLKPRHHDELMISMHFCRLLHFTYRLVPLIISISSSVG